MNLKDTQLIKDKNFIVFGEDFARHPHALEHILRPLFETNKFLWVETIGLRSPKFSFYDLKRIWGKLSKWFSLKKNISDRTTIPNNVNVITPFMIPFNQFGIIRKFNQWVVNKEIRKFIAENNFLNPITVSSVPNACDFVGLNNEILKIYFCVDEFSLWPGLNKKLVASLEEKLIQNSDLIIATSDSLASSKKIPGKLTPVISHGVEFEHFNIGHKNKTEAKLKICYFGLFDERTNQDILIKTSKEVPLSEIHIIGNVVCNIKKLKEIPNIIFHGAVSYHELPKAISEMDIFILPYHKNELTNFINPLKLKEYLSTGRPVIATDLPEVVKLKDYLLIAKTPLDFVNLANAIIKKELVIDSKKIVDYVKENETWTAKALELSKIIDNYLRK